MKRRIFERYLEKKWKDKKIDKGGYMGDDWLDGTATYNITDSLVKGTGDQERIGNAVTIWSVHVKGSFLSAGNGSTTNATLSSVEGFSSAFVRLVLILDTQSNKSNITIQDVFGNTGTNTSLFQFKNLASGSRYKILKDNVYKIDHTGGLAHDGTLWGLKVAKGSVYFELHHEFKDGLTVQYDDDAGTQMNHNSLWIAWCKDTCNTISSNMCAESVCRIRYTD
jgi:hypothetical protein